MTTVQKLATEAYGYLDTKTDRGVWAMKDGTPEWVRDLIYEAHGGMMPDDFKFRFVAEALSALADSEDTDEAREGLEPDVYHGRLLEWVGTNLNRAGYVDEVIEEGGVSDFFSLLQAGQARELDEVFTLVLSALETRAEHEEEEDEEDGREVAEVAEVSP